MRFLILSVAAGVALTARAAGDGPAGLTAVPFPDVHVTDAFWGPRIATNRTATVEALTPMRCHTIQFWHFRAFAKKNPDVTWKLLQQVAAILVNEQNRHAPHAESGSR